MRYFVNVTSPGGTPAVTVHAGSRLAQRVAKNLKTFRVWTGFDYEAFNISGISIDGAATLTSRQLTAAIQASDKNVPVDRVRMLVSDVPMNGKVGDEGLGLVIGIGEGERFAWNEGIGPMQGRITVPVLREDQRNAAMLDIFQEIMIGNCPSVQSVLRKYLVGGGKLDEFYRAKSAYISATRPTNTLMNFENHDGYVSFSALIRKTLSGILSIPEAKALGATWQDFIETKLIDYFLTTQEAVDLVRNGSFHNTKDFTRTRHSYLPEEELGAILSDRQLIAKSGSYILCALTRNPKPGDLDEAAARFGRTSANRIGRLKLCDNESYSQMRTLVEHGVVTPFRLFLKRP